MIDFLQNWHSAFLDPERIPFVIAAILITAIIGMISGPLVGTGNANPFMWLVFDKAFGGVGERMNKTRRAKADLVFRGFLITALALLIAAALGKALDSGLNGVTYGGVGEAILLSCFVTSGAVWFALLRLYFAMEKDQIGQGAYFAISRSTRTNLAASDDFTITRAGMNYAAKSFDKGLIAPALWYIIAGFQGVAIYSVVAVLSWHFGREGFSKGFGSVPLALEKLMGFVPAVLSALLITLAGLFTPTAKLHKGLAAWMGHKNRASYEQGGMPLSSLAWSLNVSLGGTRQDLDGTAIKSDWVGPEGATAQNDHKHLRRAIYINVFAHILFIAVLLGMYLWAGLLGGEELRFIKL